MSEIVQNESYKSKVESDALDLLNEIISYVEVDYDSPKQNLNNNNNKKIVDRYSTATTTATISANNRDSTKDASIDSSRAEDPLLQLQRYDKEMLIAIALESSSGLRRAEKDVKQMRIELQDAIKEQEESIALKKAHKELQEAHLVQAKFIQKLQKDYSKVT
jgi:hypothetical protein